MIFCEVLRMAWPDAVAFSSACFAASFAAWAYRRYPKSKG